MQKIFLILDVLFMVLYLSAMLYVTVRNHGRRTQENQRIRKLPVLLAAASVLLFCNFLNSSAAVVSLPMILLLSVVSFLVLSSSFLDARIAVMSAFVVSSVEVAFSVLNLLVVFGVLSPFPDVFYRWASVVLPLVTVSVETVIVWSRLRSVRAVLKSGGVWEFVCVSVESLYWTFVVVALAVVSLEIVSSILLGLTSLAVMYRLVTDRMFIVRYDLETAIVESINEPRVEVRGSQSRADTAYGDIYKRVVAYFEEDLPYLNSSLVIDDLVKVIYSNKLYISRAISMFTGRNFCQFVNYYRVKHSVDVFRQNPDLKVVELAAICGFNSTVSFTMAFKLFMKESPSEWIRKERSIMLRKGRMGSN